MNKIEELENKIAELQKEVEKLKNEKKNEKWKPKNREKYWCFNRDTEVYHHSYWDNDKMDNARYNAGVIFRSEEEAQNYANYQKAKKEYSYNFSREEWENGKIEKFVIYFDYNTMFKLKILPYSVSRYLGRTYFETKEKAQEFIDKYKKQILKYEFGIEE